MPGIFGFVRKRGGDAESNKRLISGMESKLSHSPEYESETYSDAWCGIGNIGLPWHDEQRLAVDKDRGMAAAFSGYIYGWKNIEHEFSDPARRKAQRLIEIYGKHNKDLPEKIDGSFNAVVMDLRSREAVLCNDRFGHRQLYYYQDKDIFMFSTEAKAFLAYECFAPELDREGAADFFNYTFLLGDKTFFKGVGLLRGGDIIRIAGAYVSFGKYWDYRYGDESRRSVAELIEEADSIYRGVIKRRIGSANTVIIPLSGGLDSRFIAAHTTQAGARPHAFTHGRKGCSDLQIARKVANTLNIRNHGFIEIDPGWVVDHNERFVYFTEGMVESSPAILFGIGNQYGLSARESVFLNGIYGGPGNFGSVFITPADIAENPSHEQKIERLEYYLGGAIDEDYYRLFSKEFRSQLKRNFRASIEKEFQKFQNVSGKFYQQKDVFFFKNNIGRYMNQVDCNRYIWHDHFALSDDRLLDFYMRLPAPMHFSRAFMIEYFKAKFPNLARIPYQKTGVDLYSKPSQIRIKTRRYMNRVRYYAERLSRGHLRFYDRDSYFHLDQAYRAHRKIRDFYEQNLLDDRTSRRGFFDRGRVEALLKRQRVGGNSAMVISSLLTFEMFNRLFIDR